MHLRRSVCRKACCRFATRWPSERTAIVPEGGAAAAQRLSEGQNRAELTRHETPKHGECCHSDHSEVTLTPKFWDLTGSPPIAEYHGKVL